MLRLLENYKNMQEFFEDCKAKALLETWRELKGTDNEKQYHNLNRTSHS